MDVESVRIESDERGFELVLDTGRTLFRFNIHNVVFDLYGEVVREVVPYIAEAQAAKREYDTGIADDPTQQAVLDRIKGVD